MLVSLLATLVACGADSIGPTNSEVVGQAAGLSAVSIADLPTTRTAPVVSVAISSRLVVYEGPGLDASEGKNARLWVFSPDSGTWSDPLELDVTDQLTGLSAVAVQLGSDASGQYLVVVGQRCPSPQAATAHGDLRCGPGPSALVAVTVALSTPVVGVVNEGPVTSTFAADGTVDGAPFVAPVARWDGTQVLVVAHPATGATSEDVSSSDSPLHLDVTTGSFSPGAPDELATRGLPVTCGRASHVARGVAGDVAALSVVTEGGVSEIRDVTSPPEVLACSSGTAVLGPPPHLEVVALGSSATRSITVPGYFGPDSSVLALTQRQVVMVGDSSIAVLSADRPPVVVAEGAFLPATVCSDGADSYVRRQGGTRLAFTHLINQR